MKKRLVLLMALSLTFAFPAAVMAEDTTAAEETADDTEAADSTAEDADVKSEGVMTHDEYLAAAVDDEVTIFVLGIEGSFIFPPGLLCLYIGLDGNFVINRCRCEIRRCYDP